jgi:hypothetical protein
LSEIPLTEHGARPRSLWVSIASVNRVGLMLQQS